MIVGERRRARHRQLCRHERGRTPRGSDGEHRRDSVLRPGRDNNPLTGRPHPYADDRSPCAEKHIAPKGVRPLRSDAVWRAGPTCGRARATTPLRLLDRPPSFCLLSRPMRRTHAAAEDLRESTSESTVALIARLSAEHDVPPVGTLGQRRHSRGVGRRRQPGRGHGPGRGDPPAGPGRGRRGRDARRNAGPHHRPLPPSPRARRPVGPGRDGRPRGAVRGTHPGSAPQHEPGCRGNARTAASPLLPGLPRRGARCGPRRRATARRPPPPAAGCSRPPTSSTAPRSAASGAPTTAKATAARAARDPDAITVQNGIMTIRGDSKGTTGGMAW